MGFWNFGDLRTLLDTETDHDSPGSEELVSQIRENIEALFMLLLSTSGSGTATSDPSNNSYGYFFDTAAGFVDDQHNGRTLLILSGAAKGNTYTIDDTFAAYNELACTGDNLYADGVRAGDSYRILYDIKVNADGHDHDGINSSVPVLGNGSIINAKLKTGGFTATGNIAALSSVDITGQDYSFAPNIYSDGTSVLWTGYSSSVVDYGMRFGLVNIDAVSTRAYAYRFRYITASDKPFVYGIKDKATGELLHILVSDDPPPEYWGCTETPPDFVPPIRLGNVEMGNNKNSYQLDSDRYEEIVCWNVEKPLQRELLETINKGPLGACKKVNETFEFKAGKVKRKAKPANAGPGQSQNKG